MKFLSVIREEIKEMHLRIPEIWGISRTYGISVKEAIEIWGEWSDCYL